MTKVTSADGTAIAFERSGTGRPMILVAGATCDRRPLRPLAERLAERFNVINYDRRGRGDSGDTAPYAVDREIEDLGAIIAEVGGPAWVYGHSSGAGLVLHAAAQGLPITKVVLHEPPYGTGTEEERRESEQLTESLNAVLAEGRNADALAIFYGGTGMPPEMIEQICADPVTVALAPTLAYDFAIMGDGGPPLDLVAKLAVPTLVLNGGSSPEWMIDSGRRITAALPDGRHTIVADHGHAPPPEVLGPLLTDFFAG